MARFIRTLMMGLAAVLFVAGCTQGGELSLESTGVVNKGSPYVSLKQGGKSLLVEDGQTQGTGVHGWVSIQTSGGNLQNHPTNPTHFMTINKVVR